LVQFKTLDSLYDKTVTKRRWDQINDMSEMVVNVSLLHWHRKGFRRNTALSSIVVRL